MHRAEDVQRIKNKIGGRRGVPAQLEENYDDGMNEESNFNNDEGSQHTDLENQSQDNNQSHSGVDEGTEDIDESAEDTNGSVSEISNLTYSSKRARSPVEASNKRLRHIDTVDPSGTPKRSSRE
ncbi:uncharacterized protein MELLADRAFT_60694 [Melampsora larici-populina 98AG31]|uniref:Uncharacterized protein n=1 Tax=Melampsora larici-populina (strain 98AG31 / pathotype 3-4-7) TaxID=747676 RepID=F4RBZ9_MELLP|nr:uncharacterized protein MELLADRAFT_60694 [Melampsora larici-populina 98AG31]EGG10248.1 hypothetical protein MELLADRAFT_60694 [Melampsora larici-populina 98AG31]